MTTNRILIVEDDAILLSRLGSALARAGYGVVEAGSGVEALAALVRRPVDVIVLDLGLPDLDGMDVIAGARAISEAPIVVLSGRVLAAEKIAALDQGAKDYLAKPFDMDELLARIRVALRTGVSAEPAAEGALEFDFVSRRAFVEGRPVRLSMLQARFLKAMFEADGAIVPHQALFGAIWTNDKVFDLGALRVLAWQVRHKIEPDSSAPRFLVSETGVGYRLNLKGLVGSHAAASPALGVRS